MDSVGHENAPLLNNGMTIYLEKYYTLIAFILTQSPMSKVKLSDISGRSGFG
jgi:hypothetical protein